MNMSCGKVGCCIISDCEIASLGLNVMVITARIAIHVRDSARRERMARRKSVPRYRYGSLDLDLHACRGTCKSSS